DQRSPAATRTSPTYSAPRNTSSSGENSVAPSSFNARTTSATRVQAAMIQQVEPPRNLTAVISCAREPYASRGRVVQANPILAINLDKCKSVRCATRSDGWGAMTRIRFTLGICLDQLLAPF